MANQPQTDPEERITVSINAQERIFVGERPINLQLLEDTVRGMMEGRTLKVVYLRADEGLRYGRVITVVDKLKSAPVVAALAAARAAASAGTAVLPLSRPTWKPMSLSFQPCAAR